MGYRIDKLDLLKMTGPDENHPRVLRELSEAISEPFAIIFENSWRMHEVQEDRRRANTIPIFKKGNKENPGNYRPVSLTSIPRKILEKINKQSIRKHLKQWLSNCVGWDPKVGWDPILMW